MTFYVYILECYKGEEFRCFYTGQCKDLWIRMGQHISYVKAKQYAHFTGRFDFVKLVWNTKVETRSEAIKLERFIKSLTHDDKEMIVEKNMEAQEIWEEDD